jgi:hypothetical protein
MQRLRRGSAGATVLLLLIFFLVYLAPIPGSTVASNAARLLFSSQRDSVVIAGNSVVDHVSRCASDKRRIPALIRDELGRGVIDVSSPGQPEAESLNYLAFALRHSKASSVVLFVPARFQSFSLPDLQTQEFFYLTASSAFGDNSLTQRTHAGVPLLGGINTNFSPPFTYNHVNYPNYDGIKDIYLTRELEEMSCPETLGNDRQFIEAYYWESYLARPVRNENISGLKELQQIAIDTHKTLIILLEPVDFDDVESLSLKLAEAMRAQIRSNVKLLQQANVQFLDLTESMHADDFSDRYCACGHLSSKGARAVAERVSALLKAVDQQSASPSGD